VRWLVVAIAACAGSNEVHELRVEATAIAVRYRPLLDVEVLRVARLKRELRGNRPGWENALRIAELANDELGLPPFTQVVPPGPAWRPSPASLLGIAPYVETRADELARTARLDELQLLVRDERARYAAGIAEVDDRLSQVERWLLDLGDPAVRE
jgi:hypothetical protein